MNKRVVIAVLVIIVIIILLCWNIRDSENVEETIGEDVLQEGCVKQVGDIVVGKWEQESGDKKGSLSLELLGDETFRYSRLRVAESEGFFNGTWKISVEEPSIELNFNEFDPNIEKVLTSNENIYEIFPGLVSYNVEKNIIKIKIHYMGRETFQHCEDKRYFIDWFGNYLYKSEQTIRWEDEFSKQLKA